MKKIALLCILICMVSCDKIIGGWTDIVFDTPELYFDSHGGHATVMTEFPENLSWKLIRKFDKAGCATTYYPQKNEESIVLDNIIVRYDKDQKEFDITVPSSNGIYEWEVYAYGIESSGSIYIHQNHSE